MSERTSTSETEVLQQAAEGLLLPSETDAPLTPFFWPQNETASKETATLAPDQLAKLAGIAADTPIKSVKLETFFRPTTQDEEWHNDEEKAAVEKFKILVKIIKDTLADVKVFRVGETKVDVYIVGTVEGGYAGLKTHVVET